ncbi:alginate lyase precursor [Pseudopedobacter saltans DSM 12145]|uniref:Alginate lyase n=1 Tax=Pseudopedobacter saltans (strain ATCC 51119 / DSM 12145 / JCM 21818 / CCUG 39354 / LMG 10337 / NBRC 100064 / NCIMB 13643) TaxID=762903 RepID=F0S8M1_PSESL|nr:polysaccharide lyase 6 family protein [Pseudopedobacter saltans]ADY51305.1 alginate lyase precursor [Pseudopedobacter saltans DSM 12145]
MKWCSVFLMMCLVIKITNIQAKEYKIKSASELEALTLLPGDKVILKSGVWTDQKLIMKGLGTKEKNIVFSGEGNGSTIISKGSTLLIEGKYLTVENLKFVDTNIPKGSIVFISKAAENCRFTNNVFLETGENLLSKDTFFAWITMYGVNNRIDHCYFKGKTNKGCTIVAEAEKKPGYNRIDHNFFDHRPELGMNGGESIRAGNWNTSMFSSHITIEENIFKNCNGEIEIISNKSCNNIIRNNLFYESNGTISLRHGKRATVAGNVFIGNKKNGIGGIRVTGEGHRIFDNYFSGIIGADFYAPVSFRNAWENPPLHGYDQVKDCAVFSNTFINCGIPFYIGVGKDEKSFVVPVNTTIANNLIYSNDKALKIIEPKYKFEIIKNLVSSSSTESAKGFIKENLHLQSKKGLAYIKAPSSVKPHVLEGAKENYFGSRLQDGLHEKLLKAKKIGPSWYPIESNLIITN